MQLKNVLRQHADASRERPLAVAAATVRPVSVQPVGLGVHPGVQDLLSEPARQLLHIDTAVVELDMANMSGIGSENISAMIFVLS